MKYMLDTNICIYLMNCKNENLTEKFHKINPDDLCISNITYSELIYGVEKSKNKELNFTRLVLFLSEINIINYNFNASEEYGKIRADLEKQGNAIGSNDLFIAAHAKSLGLTLITNNEKEFSRVNGLKAENWIEK